MARMIMPNRVRYALTYRKLEETIKSDNFESLYDALAYCKREDIHDPIAVHRLETIEDQVLSRTQILKLLHPEDE